MTWSVGTCNDDEAIRVALERERFWAAYAICDLTQPYRAHSDFICAVDGDTIDAVLLKYAPPGLTVLVPCGEPDGVAVIFREFEDLPHSAFMTLRWVDVPAARERYDLEEELLMDRMVLYTRNLRRPPSHGGIARLGPGDIDAVRELYVHWPDGSMPLDALSHGVMFGVFTSHAGRNKLVAVAGTHAVSEEAGMAAVGGVFTHPDYRGRGLAKAVTGAVAAELQTRGVRDIVLNVRADNVPALAAYRSLGFESVLSFAEGQATLLP